MQHDSGLVGDFAVREGSRVALLLLVEDAVLGQQQVQEERGDRADGVRSLEEDDQSRAVRVLALVVVVAAAAVVVRACARRLGLGHGRREDARHSGA